MPNIEIHGVSEEQGEDLRRKIFETFRYEVYAGEMVVGIVNDEFIDINGSSQPFVRLLNTRRQPPAKDYTIAIVEGLRRLNVDIEVLQTQQFVPKKPSRPAVSFMGSSD
jgi:hypothetical protein